MPEPEWTRIGTTSTDKDVFSTINWPDGSATTHLLGKVDLYVEVYKVANDDSSGQTNYACIPHIKQWPGQKLDGGAPAYNKYTMLEQDWTNNTFGGLEITDWGPTESKTGSIDWSATISVGTSGSGAGLSVSYDVPHISRDITSEYNQTVSQEYTYPHTVDPLDSEAREQIVGLKNFGEVWLDDEPQCPGRWYKPCPQELLSVHISSDFMAGIDKPDSPPLNRPYRKITSSTNIDKFISLRTIGL